MPRVPDVPCVECGKLTYTSRTSSPPHKRVCRDCTRKRPGYKGKRPTRVRVPKTCECCGVTWTPQRIRENRFCPKCVKSPKRQVVCAFCGQAGLTSASTTGLYCSHRCAMNARHGRSSCTDLVHAPVPMRTFTPAHVFGDRILVAGECQRCGDPYTLPDQVQARYCSKRCARRDAGARRRALKRGAFVGRVYRNRIFERDGWRCQLCRRKVAKREAVPHPRAPTLDHIIPLAAGGTHEPSNVQLACFQCNSIKGHRVANDQLRLIG